MRRFGLVGSTPKVDALARRGDVPGLVQAARYQDLVPGRDGEVYDVGAPIREAAVRALAARPEPPSEEIVLRALGDPTDRVRAAAVEWLREQGDAAVLALAVGHWPAARDGRARQRATESLLELGAPDTSRQLVTALLGRPGGEPLSDRDTQLVRDLLEAEGRAEALDQVLALLLQALRTGTEIEMARARSLLVRLAPASLPPLVRELEAGETPTRAAEVLGLVKDASALNPLVAALEHGDPEVRAAAASALGQLRDPVAVAPLLRVTRDSEHLVRASAGAALDQLGTVATVVGVSSAIQSILANGQRANGGVAGLEANGGATRALPPGPRPVGLLRRVLDRVERSLAPEDSGNGGQNG